MDQGRQFISHPRILLLEPDRQRVDQFRDVFVRNGFETEVALNREVTLAVLSERRMDALLIDAEVTGKACGELVKEFHDLDPGMIICIINGVKEKTKQRLVKKLGAQSYLSAPTEGDRAFKAVVKLLTKRL